MCQIKVEIVQVNTKALRRISDVRLLFIHMINLLCCRTPLHYAASTAQFQCVLSLVANGGSVNELDNGKRTPLHYASASDSDAKYRTIIISGNSK